MARQEVRHASTKPSEAQRGGTIGIPAGSVATIVEACWATWGDAGEGALKGGRSADDPALKVVADVDGAEEAIVEFLGAGKKLVPSDDGEFLDIVPGSSAVAISDSCNATFFLKSVSDQKRHGKAAVDEDLMDEGISKFLVGLKFVAGREIIKRDWAADDGQQRQARPTLVCDEILEQPTAVRKGGKSSASPKAPARGVAKATSRPEPEDEPEDEAAEVDDNDYSEKAEGYMLQVLDMPKCRKGLAVRSAWSAVFNLVRGEEAGLREAVTEMVRDQDWVRDSARPWAVEGDLIVRV